MSVGNILIHMAAVLYIVYKRMQGKQVLSLKSLALLPVIIVVIGYGDLSKGSMNPTDVAFVVAGCALSLVLGGARGWVSKLSVRNDRPFVQWGKAALVIFAVNIALKLLLDLVCVAVGGTSNGVTSSLVISIGLMLAGEAAVVYYRIQAEPSVYGVIPSGFEESSNRRGRDRRGRM